MDAACSHIFIIRISTACFKMKYWFYLGHPAHFHLVRNSFDDLKKKGHECRFIIKKKEFIEELLKENGYTYDLIVKRERKKKGKLSLIWIMVRQDFNLFRLCLKGKPDIGIGTSEHFSHVGKILRFPSINLNEDDASVVPLYCMVAYPLASVILSPVSCNNGKWEYKSIKYRSFHELAYLHPNHFVPDRKVVEKYFSPDEPFFILRFSGLYAHHDAGKEGIDLELANTIIGILSKYGKVYITSERELEPSLEKYRVPFRHSDMHHIMAFSRLFIGDSQTMAAEAGVLGTPFIRYNSFVGRIGYLNELERDYKLGVGIKAGEKESLLQAIEEMSRDDRYQKENLIRKQQMLNDKFDFAKFLTWFIENYPRSKELVKAKQILPEQLFK